MLNLENNLDEQKGDKVYEENRWRTSIFTYKARLKCSTFKYVIV